ncbi:erythroid differentiation-related factor 1-like [Acyrthosiphon pisum]|uniref:Erythroid differentiation-related factor 1 n=1 Tax=Acyrthosiphon pisum TaxID=7029 RepID=A0A8R1X1Y0_ACYPI|nr:erythroid differentiation-related factor 1-like [Acyrthosiphon pisum]|eukprot:XP_008180391.1 PREDICTED: erythroid differentiation-related factor 1-like isoform X2 [Acyrthosiphon pisum]
MVFLVFKWLICFTNALAKWTLYQMQKILRTCVRYHIVKKSVSMMVHRIDKTLLLDEFDIQKYLIVETDNEWDWLKNFFYKNIVGSSDKMVKCITYKMNTLRANTDKALVSKFLHHSIELDSHNDQIKKKNVRNETSPLASALPKISPEDVFSNSSQMHKLFNRHFLWDFEGMEMLIGTDLPIFGSSNNSRLSSRLRDMSKPLSMLTGMNYWLDNLMCNIPETELCYNINGVLQNYELVKTENLPSLNGSAFSPKNVSDIIQNTLSFLKSNANSVGHTYWLFKGKNDDVLKLYDLTTLCSESLAGNPNPFAVPVVILLYRIACKSKHNLEDIKLYIPATIQLLLNICLQLDKTKYPQIVACINCMLSEMYISIYNNPSTIVIEDSTDVNKDSATCHDDSVIASAQFDYGTYSIDIQNLCVSHNKENISFSEVLEYPASKHLIKTIEECYYKALYYIGSSLSCFEYFENDKDIMGKAIGKNNMPSWHNPSNAGDNRNHLRLVLYKKASDAYFNLGEKSFTSRNFGIALKCFRLSLECQLCITDTDVNHIFMLVLEHCGNCCLFIFKNWDKIEQYSSELETDEEYDFELRKALLNSSNRTNKDLNLIPTSLNNSKESMLSTAEHCYSRALTLKTNTDDKNNLSKQIGYVYNENIKIYIEEIIMAISNNIPLSPLKLKRFAKKSKTFCSLGSNIFQKVDDKDNLAIINSNLEKLYGYIAHYSTKYVVPLNTFVKTEIINFKAGKAYKKRLSKMGGNRSSNSQQWDMVYYKLSSSLFHAAVNEYLAICRCNSSNYRKCIDLFMEALDYCDLKNESPKRFVYEYQAAYINFGLASLSFGRLEQCFTEESPELHPVFVQIKSYCNISFEIFFKIERPLESFEVLIKMITLDIHLIDRTIGPGNLKYVKSIIETLEKCVAVFQMFSENKDTMKYSYSADQTEELTIEDGLHFEMRKLHFLLILEENVLKLLKCMIHLALDKSSVKEIKWLADKEDELKIIYSVLLRNSVGDNNYSQLMTAVKQLSTFK